MFEGISGKIRDMVDDSLEAYENNIATRGPAQPFEPVVPPLRSAMSQESRRRPLPEPMQPVGTTDSAIVLFDYKPAQHDTNDLELVSGEIITNINTRSHMADTGWWFGQDERGRNGLFPSNYVELLRRSAPHSKSFPAVRRHGLH
jgi:Variant SH3 domain